MYCNFDFQTKRYARSLQFQRVEQQITSLDTLLEQEKKYLEILVSFSPKSFLSCVI